VLDAHPGIVEQVSPSGERMPLRTGDGVLKTVSLGDGTMLAAFQWDKQIITCDGDAELKWLVARDQGGQMDKCTFSLWQTDCKAACGSKE